MTLMSYLIPVLVWICTYGFGVSSGTPLVCYYELEKYNVDILQYTNCDYLILIGSAHLTEGGHFDVVEADIWELRKAYYKSTILSVTSSNPSFTRLTSQDYLMRKFANDTLTIVKKHNLRGIDIDWEFPVWSSDADKSDRSGLARLLEILHEFYSPAGKLVSIAVSGPPTITRVGYDVEAIGRYADMIQVMNYDFHVFNKLSNPFVGFNAPLHKMTAEISVLGEMNVEASMNAWIDLGLPMNKTFFGIPTYARAFQLLTRFVHKPYSPAIRALDEYTNYGSICTRFIRNDTYTKVWNKRAQAPYLYGPDGIWISYEDERSLLAKVAFARKLGVAGIMVYSIGSDDHGGFNSCYRDQGGSYIQFPQLKWIRKFIGKGWN